MRLDLDKGAQTVNHAAPFRSHATRFTAFSTRRATAACGRGMLNHARTTRIACPGVWLPGRGQDLVAGVPGAVETSCAAADLPWWALKHDHTVVHPRRLNA